MTKFKQSNTEFSLIRISTIWQRLLMRFLERVAYSASTKARLGKHCAASHTAVLSNLAEEFDQIVLSELIMSRTSSLNLSTVQPPLSFSLRFHTCSLRIWKSQLKR